MNVYEASPIVSPMIGIPTGITSMRGSTLWGEVSGASVGLTVGPLLHSGVMVLVKVIIKMMRTDAERDLTNLQLALGPLAVLLPMLVPVATMFVTSALVKVILI
jgi:hypothetical protein